MLGQWPIQPERLPECSHYAKDSRNFGGNSNGKVCFSFFRPECWGSSLEAVFLFWSEYSDKDSPFQEQGWRRGESARLSPMCPGFDSRTRCHMRVEFVGSLSCSETFFSRYSGFPLSSKTNISKFQFDLDYCQALYNGALARVIAQALPVCDVIYQTLDTVFHRDIQTPRRELKIRRAAKYF